MPRHYIDNPISWNHAFQPGLQSFFFFPKLEEVWFSQGERFMILPTASTKIQIANLMFFSRYLQN